MISLFGGFSPSLLLKGALALVGAAVCAYAGYSFGARNLEKVQANLDKMIQVSQNQSQVAKEAMESLRENWFCKLQNTKKKFIL